MEPSLSIDPLSDLRQLFAYPFMVHALQAGTIVAVMAALVGWLMVVRRQSFAGHTLSLMSFPGASLAALLGLPFVYGYYAFCLAGALAIAAGAQLGGRRDRAAESASIGVVQAAALALGFFFLSIYGGVLESLETLLFGSFLGITSGQVLALGALALAVLAVLAVVGRPLLFASVDDAVARARGVPAGALSLLFLVLLGLAVAATVQITGALLVFALLVAPAATAQQLTPRVGLGLALSVALALAVTWLGLALSYFSNLPVGFLITTLAFLLYVAARARRALESRRGARPTAVGPGVAGRLAQSAGRS
jgi:zinc/manganese transport system permease protein